MRVIRSAPQMTGIAQRLRRQGKSIGVVATMGALHEGHLSLIRAAASAEDVVIVTLFVNPLQFGPTEDYARYPRPFTRDLRLARRAGADILFAPTAQQMYPNGFASRVHVGSLGECWEGQSRPGHFDGVATVVTTLFHLTEPTTAYFGQKDYQQTLVVKQLIRDLHLPVRLRVLPTVREPDGLAMSSRNQSLNASQRRRAPVLGRALRRARAQIRGGERRAAAIAARLRRLIRSTPEARIDYAALVDADTLRPLRRLRGRVVLLVAVWIGGTRLIDNLLVDVS